MQSKITLTARVVLGLIFFVFGLNGFFHFIPMPPMPGEAGKFLGALAGTGYFFPFLKVCEIVAGGLLLLGAFVPFALMLLSPIVANILLFHLFLAPAGLAVPIVSLVCLVYLGVFSKEYSGVCRSLLRLK